MSKRPTRKSRRSGGVGANQTNRRETSRVAAKIRREHENAEIYELARLLPLPPAIASQLDKASILRITISYIRMKTFFDRADRGWMEGDAVVHPRTTRRIPVAMDDTQVSQYMVQALDGFVLVISCTGSVLYVSETVSTYLGLSQVDLIGRSLFDYCHSSDHQDLKENLNPTRYCRSERRLFELETEEDQKTFLDSNTDGSGASSLRCTVSHRDSDWDRSFFLLIKNILSKKGGEKNGIKCPGYKVIQVVGKMRFQHDCSSPRQRCNPDNCLGLLAVCKPLDPPTMREICHLGNCFMSRHSLDMKFIFCDSRISHLTGYDPADMLGKVVYHFHHPNDMSTIAGCHSNLIAKGQSVSQSYRFLARDGRWMWLQTSATIAYNSRSQRAQYITCLNYVVSEDKEEAERRDAENEPPASASTSTSDQSDTRRPTLDLSKEKKNSRFHPGTLTVTRKQATVVGPSDPSLIHSYPSSRLPAGIPPLNDSSLTPMPENPSSCAEVELFDKDPKLLGEAIAAPYRKSSNESKRDGSAGAGEAATTRAEADVASGRENVVGGKKVYVFNDIPAQLVANGCASDKVILSGDKRRRGFGVGAKRNRKNTLPSQSESGNGDTLTHLEKEASVSGSGGAGDLSALADFSLPDGMQWTDIDRLINQGEATADHVPPPPLLFPQPGFNPGSQPLQPVPPIGNAQYNPFGAEMSLSCQMSGESVRGPNAAATAATAATSSNGFVYNNCDYYSTAAFNDLPHHPPPPTAAAWHPSLS